MSERSPDTSTQPKPEAQETSLARLRSSSEAQPAAASRPATGGWPWGGLLLVALGTGLAFLPLGADAANAGAFRPYSAALILGGLTLCAFRVQQRRIRELQSSLEEVGAQTAHLERIAGDLGTVQVAGATLTEDMGKLLAQVSRLTELTTDSENTTSLFRLAASVDQLGQRIDTRTLKHLETIGQALEKADARADEGAQATARVEKILQSQQDLWSKHLEALIQRSSLVGDQVAARLDDLGERVERQAAVEAAALRDGFEGLAGRLDRAERGQASAAEQLEARCEHSAQSVARVATALDELGKRVEEQVAMQAACLQEGFEGLVGRLDRAERGQASAAAQLETRCEHSAQSVARVASALDELGERAERQQALQAASLQAGFEGVDSRFDRVERAQVSAVEQLSKHLLEQLMERVERLLAGHVQDLEQRLAPVADQAKQASHRVASGIHTLGSSLGEYARSQQASFKQAQEQAAEAARAASRELAACLELLRTDLARQASDQAASLQRSGQESQQAAEATRRELVGSLEQFRAQVAETIETRSSGLAGEVLAVAQAVDSITAELRQCTATPGHRASSTETDSVGAEPTAMTGWSEGAAPSPAETKWFDPWGSRGPAQERPPPALPG
jgi:hypothetical protein